MAVGEWDRRELCPDGNCTGLIGPEGTCKVCGHVAPNWGDERKRGTQDADDDDEEEEDDDGVAPDPIKPATKVAIGGGEWTARMLCPDGACVGLIGEDGKCKVCGKTGVAPPRSASEADDDAEYDDDEDDDDSEGEDYADEGDEDGDEDDDELAAAADELAGVASHSEVASTSPAPAAAIERGPDGEEYRKLCPDGSCIGVIGLDGKCKICKTEVV